MKVFRTDIVTLAVGFIELGCEVNGFEGKYELDGRVVGVLVTRGFVVGLTVVEGMNEVVGDLDKEGIAEIDFDGEGRKVGVLVRVGEGRVVDLTVKRGL